MNLRSRNKVAVEFNMSSMTDMIFLLLIFFMILSTKVAENNVMRVDLPKGTSREKSGATKSVRVSVDKDLNYYVNQKQVPYEAVQGELQLLVADMAEPRVEIAVDKSVDYDVFVQLVDMIYVQNGWKPVIITGDRKQPE
ncbi:MAG: ExbD/TolR family protein [Flavobacteriales bacterium]